MNNYNGFYGFHGCHTATFKITGGFGLYLSVQA